MTVRKGHDVVGGLQGVGVAQVDFVLAGAGFVVAEFDGDADFFEHGHCLAAEVLHDAAGGVVEVGFVIHGHGGIRRRRAWRIRSR